MNGFQEKARLLAEKEENDRLKLEVQKQKNKINKEKKKGLGRGLKGDNFYSSFVVKTSVFTC